MPASHLRAPNSASADGSGGPPNRPAVIVVGNSSRPAILRVLARLGPQTGVPVPGFPV